MTGGWRSAARSLPLAIGVLGAGLAAGRPDDPEYYRSLKQAPYAPPAWAFGPAWAVAKSGTSWATTRVAGNAERLTRRQRGVLAGLAALDAAVYVSFSYVYFRRRSTRLAAVWTATDAAVTAVALPLVAKADRKASIGLVPQAAWLALATPVAVYQARHNRS